MRSIKHKWVILSAFAVLIFISACSKMDDYKDEFLGSGEIIYAGALDTAIAQPGYKRINLKMVLGKDQQVTKVKAYWNERQDSMEVQVQRPLSSDTISMLVTGLAERSYNFSVYTYDAKGHSSVVRTASGMAYGDDYVNSLANRTIQSVTPNTYYDSMLVKWSEANTGQIFTEVKYKLASNEDTVIKVPASVSVLAIPDGYLAGTELQYRSAYLPNGLAYDTLWVANYSSIILNELPEYERALSKTLFKRVVLPTDIGASTYTTWPMTNLWNGVVGGTGYATAVGPTPVWFTFDMGELVTLKRFMYWMPQDRIYNLEAVKSFEIYGSDNPASDGSWASWTYLRTCESVKPSGSAAGTNTAADIAAAAAGEEFVIPGGLPKVRYIRIKVLSHWGVGTFQAMGELTFYTGDHP